MRFKRRGCLIIRCWHIEYNNIDSIYIKDDASFCLDITIDRSILSIKLKINQESNIVRLMNEYLILICIGVFRPLRIIRIE